MIGLNMKNQFYKVVISIFTGLMVIFLLSCAEDVTPTLYDLASTNLPTPVITSVDPPAEALAGVTKITITGSNFSSTMRNNLVYFNGVPGKVLTATNTQLEVTSAVVVSDSIIIKVAVIGANSFSNEILYKLNPAVGIFYPLDAKIFQVPYGIAVDNSENVYVSLKDQGIKKIDVQGVLTDFAPKGPETFFRSMTVASDNAIYAVRGGVRGFYKVVENTAPAAFVATSQGISDNVNAIDFDKTRDVLWAGGSTGIIYRITLTKNIIKYNLTDGINAIRVAGNSLFIVTSGDKELIWKAAIVSADSLGTPELYFDFSTQVGNLTKLMDVVAAQDGDIYLGTDSDTNPVYIVHPDKSFEELYSGLINSAAYSMVWGNASLIYMSNVIEGVNTTILKLDVEKLGLK
jgi:hypothetical protein